MQPVFKHLDEKKVVGVRGKFITITSPEKNNMEVIPKLWQNFMPRRNQVVDASTKANLGVSFPIPAKEKPHPEEQYYIAGTEVKNFDHVPAGMDTLVIPAGDYAVFTHKGEINKIEQTMNYIYGIWLPSSGKKLRVAPDMEYYDERFKMNDPDSELDIYVPIE